MNVGPPPPYASENTRSLPTSAPPMPMTQPVSIVAPITIVVLGLSSFLAFGFVVAYRCVLMLAKIQNIIVRAVMQCLVLAKNYETF
ncbi:unnamed protein product [Rotaria socialis]|uniref:Uncharacterized protein n=1 Tax=Rotaria socialis TaxID=392032 RepID=A0A819B3T7_9BILA|nr:unnamed protein product [Rotaria socialis]